MTNSFIKEFLKTLPPSHINNAREILRHTWNRWEKTRSSYWAYKLSRILGFEPDLRNMHGRYTEYPKSKPGDKSWEEMIKAKKLPDNIPF